MTATCICIGCGECKPWTDAFYQRSRAGSRSRLCRECKAEKYREAVRRSTAKHLAAVARTNAAGIELEALTRTWGCHPKEETDEPR